MAKEILRYVRTSALVALTLIASSTIRSATAGLTFDWDLTFDEITGDGPDLFQYSDDLDTLRSVNKLIESIWLGPADLEPMLADVVWELSAQVDDSGVMDAGFVRLIGGVPNRGIPTDSLLFEGTIAELGLRLDAGVGGPCDPVPGGVPRLVTPFTGIHTDPRLGFSVGSGFLNRGGLICRDSHPDAPSLIDESNLFTFSWNAVQSLHGFVDLSVRVAEPTSLALLCLGLAGLGFSSRRLHGS